jgi:histone arginine demethylase JMJD6
MLYIPRKWPHAAVALEPSLSLSANFLAKCNKRAVLPTLMKYMERRAMCENILKRPLRGSDNLMKFCCHGGRVPVDAVSGTQSRSWVSC